MRKSSLTRRMTNRTKQRRHRGVRDVPNLPKELVMSASTLYSRSLATAKRASYCAGFMTVFSLAAFVPIARAGSLQNGGFDTVGPDGSPVTSIGQPYNPVASAAADWMQYAVVPESYIKTELLPTTDPWGSDNMIHVVTDNGYSTTDHFGNGFEQYFTTLQSATVSFDLYVVSGQVTAGLVVAGNEAFANDRIFNATGGWIHVVDQSNQLINDVAFETFTINAGAEYYVDNLVISSTVPEPSSLVLFGIALLLSGRFALRKRVRRQ
jgi:PEP-CTERM motif